MSISLYRKYRPQTFSDVIGQKHIVQTLSNSILNDRIAHAYLFTGPRGTGKTTMARIFARAINCTNPQKANPAQQGVVAVNPCLECMVCKNITEGKSLDIFEIDAASNTGVDNIRELRENVKFPPSQAKYKVYIIDEVHMLSTGAFNALLKTLEEPPAHVIFILATTEIHKVPETIISRCQRFDFTRLSLEHIIEKLSAIAESEKISIEKNALEMIAVAAEGGMRDAESLFAQVIAFEDKNITSAKVEEMLGTTQRQSLEALANSLLNKDATSGLSLINQLSQDGYDLDVFNKSFLNYLRQIMLVSVDEKLAKLFSFELTSEQSAALLTQAKGRTAKEILFIVQCFTEIQGKIKSSFIPQLPLEMAIIKAVNGPQAIEPTSNLTQTAAPVARPATPVLQPKTEIPKPPVAPTPQIEKVKAPTAAAEKIEVPIEVTAPALENQPTENLAPLDSNAFSLNDVKKCWNQAMVEIKVENHSLAAVMPSCQAVSVENGIITIAAKFPFHKDKLEELKNKLTVENVFAKILGSSLRLKFVSAKEIGLDMGATDRPQASSTSDTPKETMPSETSSLLSSAMGIMGGQIVE